MLYCRGDLLGVSLLCAHLGLYNCCFGSCTQSSGRQTSSYCQKVPARLSFYLSSISAERRCKYENMERERERRYGSVVLLPATVAPLPQEIQENSGGDEQCCPLRNKRTCQGKNRSMREGKQNIGYFNGIGIKQKSAEGPGVSDASPRWHACRRRGVIARVRFCAIRRFPRRQHDVEKASTLSLRSQAPATGHAASIFGVAVPPAPMPAVIRATARSPCGFGRPHV